MNRIHTVERVYVPAPQVIPGPPVAVQPVTQPVMQSVVEPMPLVAELQPTVPDSVLPVEEAILVGDYFSEWAVRLSTFYATDFGDISQGKFGLLLQAPGSLGLDVSASMLLERGVSFRDHLWVGDANVVYEMISGDLRARMGVGVNWLGDRYGGDAGFNLTVGFDQRLTSRWHMSGEVDLGSLADSDLLHAQLTLGRRFDNAEWVVGYDHFDIGGTTIGSMVTGLRFRF